MTPTITPERPDTMEAQALIAELEGTPLRAVTVITWRSCSPGAWPSSSSVWTARRRPGGDGGVQLFGTDYAEIKRMYVRPQFRGLGLARQILDHLAGYARAHGARLLRLETGVHQQDAIRLYEGWGFERIPPFGEYREDPLSRFYEKQIAGQAA